MAPTDSIRSSPDRIAPLSSDNDSHHIRQLQLDIRLAKRRQSHHDQRLTKQSKANTPIRFTLKHLIKNPEFLPMSKYPFLDRSVLRNRSAMQMGYWQDNHDHPLHKDIHWPHQP